MRIGPVGGIGANSADVAYALVYLAGGAVKVCERGIGDHPWAANAEPVHDVGQQR